MNFEIETANINYVKIEYKDSNEFTHYIKAAIRLINEFEIIVSIKSATELSIETPQDINLGIVTDSGVYKSKSILKNIEKDEPYYILSVLKPKEMEYQQKREYFRVKLQENVVISPVTEGAEDSFKPISAITYDISANGVRIEVDDSEQKYPNEVMLTLYLQNRQINVNARFVRFDNEDGINKASFNFINLSELDADYIFQICFNKQIEERRKR